MAVLGLAVGLLAAAPSSAQQLVLDLDTLRVDVLSLAGPSRLTRAVQVLGADELRRLPARTLGEAMAWALGVDVEARSPAQTDVSLRGSTFEQVVVLVDGVRMSDAQTGHFDMDLTVPLERVERIEVLRGPASSLYGPDAVGGVVNIVTRVPGARTASARVEAGSFGSRSATLSAGERIGDLGVAFGLETASSDGHRPGTDHEATQLHGALRTDLAGGVVRLEGGWARRDFGADGFYAPFPSYERTRTGIVALGWSGGVGRVRLDPRAWRRTHDDDFTLKRDDPSFYRNVHVSSQLGAELLATRRLGTRTSVSWGAEWTREAIDSDRLGNRREDRLATYAEWTAPVGRAEIRVGGRVDRYEAFGVFVAPQISLAAPAGDRLRIRIVTGRAFRAPTWTERFYVDPANRGTPDLAPERSWSLEGGLDVALAGSALARLTAFARRTDDLIDWSRASGEGGLWETRNVERSDVRGIEIAVEGVRAGPFSLEAGATLLGIDATERSGFESKYALRPLTRKLTLAVSTSRARRIQGSARVISAHRRDDESGFSRLDARVVLSAGPGSAFADLLNAFGVTYPDVTRLPAPGRSLSVGYRWRVGG